ncbi:hypothetical protein OZX72_00100 [Bifidobacterium sp. ESL0769]|uniref:hypothetical protein n=1 Tax=Bifidobacterium sp. ESL0769 TaxID=2983229 RepID=UPI0023F6ADB6|nr:hypothetical protein [Bifidobacterium sp. ESL0769]WEV67457.1 hypothetical protein OZX72_00100 [Bifidobacterium sp. ESL0769]
MLATALPLAGCGTGTPGTENPRAQSQNTTPKEEQTDKGKTKTITYDKFFVKHYLLIGADDSPENTAKIFKDQHDDYTDAYATPDGDVVITMTEKQLEGNIKEYKKERKEFGQAFNKDAKDKYNDYRFQISKDGRTFSLWCDNKLTDKDYVLTLGSIPKINGCLYYLEGGSGPWDMQVNIYNCHSGQPMQQYPWSQSPDYQPQNYGA